MLVVVTGAGGFIGRAIVEALTRESHEVTASDRPGVDLSHIQSARAVEADLLDAGACERLLEGQDAIVHSAGLFDLSAARDALVAANATTVERVTAACEETGVRRLVHLSSVAVYGRPESVPCPTSAALRPRHPYEETKAAGDRIARDAMDRLDVTVLRPTVVYGPGSRYGFAPFIAALYLPLAAGQERVWGVRKASKYHAVHVEDVSRAVAFALAEPKTIGGVYNLADDSPADIMTALETICVELGMSVDRRPNVPGRVMSPLAEAIALWAPEKRLQAANREIDRRWRRLAEELDFSPILTPKLDRDWLYYFAADHVYDNRDLVELGFFYRHPDLQRGIPSTLAWYIDAGWLPKPDAVREWARARRQSRPERKRGLGARIVRAASARLQRA